MQSKVICISYGSKYEGGRKSSERQWFYKENLQTCMSGLFYNIKGHAHWPCHNFHVYKMPGSIVSVIGVLQPDQDIVNIPCIAKLSMLLPSSKPQPVVLYTYHYERLGRTDLSIPPPPTWAQGGGYMYTAPERILRRSGLDDKMPTWH